VGLGAWKIETLVGEEGGLGGKVSYTGERESIQGERLRRYRLAKTSSVNRNKLGKVWGNG